MCMCVCIFAIFLDILSEKVTALLSFVFVDSVPKIKANLCVCFFLTYFTMIVDVQGPMLCL